MDKKFNYGKAEADLYDSGCNYSDEIYGHRSENSIREFMNENGLNPDKYFENASSSSPLDPNSNDTGGCYLTSACVNAKGLPDDCDDLMTLRNYRDTYLVNRAGGTGDIAHYYKTAPQIVSAINNRDNSSTIWEEVYEDLVRPCVRLIKQGEYEKAYDVYKGYTLGLAEKYLRVKADRC